MKKLISILLVVTMVFSLLPVLVHADEPTESVTETPSFHAPTIRNMIELNLSLGNIDEEFYHVLANAYLTDPALLSQTIADLTADEITYLAKAISYDLQKTSRTALAILPDDCGTPEAAAVARIIFTERSDPSNADLAAFMDAEMITTLMAPAAELNSDYDVFISMDVDSTGTASVASPTNVRVTVGSHTKVSYERSYAIEVHKVVNGIDSVATLTRVKIPANEFGKTTVIPITFSSAGNYTVYAVLCEGPSNDRAETTHHSLSVNGKWHITVELTADRSQLGTITLYDASGTEVSSSICLGKSARNLAMNQEFGHTPIGVYTGYLDGKKSDTEKYGPHQYIRMHGYSGYVVEECSHRSGLLIDGGREGYNNDVNRPSYPLYKTEGCVRVTNTYQQQLENEITTLILNNHETIGFITITQDGQITL